MTEPPTNDERTTRLGAIPRFMDHDPPYPPSDLIAGAIDDGSYVFVSGTVGFALGEAADNIDDPLLPAPLADGIEGQTRAILTHITKTLHRCNIDINHIVKVNAYLTNLERDGDGYNRVFKEFFGTHKPTRTTVGVELVGQMLVEIDCVARRNNSR